MKKEEGELMSY